jgi:tripartite-type tricarboxylate transporter receptor subunit TctC
MRFSTIIVRAMSLGMLLAVAGTVSAQQPYPSRPVRFIIPFPPGGSTDPMGRMFATKLTERWGQTVIVDNRPGGSTIIGTDLLAKAAPDGYTLGWLGGSFFSLPSLFSNLPFDVHKDFAGVTTFGKTRIVLVLHPSVPANNLQEFIALAKAKPGELNFASSGVGTNVHLSGELFNQVAGTRMIHIPYKGSGPVTTDLLGGRVQLSFQVPITVIPFINAGRLKAIAVTGETRLSALPQVPTFSEAGLPKFGWSGLTGIIAPAKTPRPVLGRIASEVAAIVAMPSTQDFIVKQGGEPLASTPEQTAALIREEIASYSKIIKEAGVKPQQ